MVQKRGLCFFHPGAQSRTLCGQGYQGTKQGRKYRFPKQSIKRRIFKCVRLCKHPFSIDSSQGSNACSPKADQLSLLTRVFRVLYAAEQNLPGHVCYRFFHTLPPAFGLSARAPPLTAAEGAPFPTPLMPRSRRARRRWAPPLSAECESSPAALTPQRLGEL